MDNFVMRPVSYSGFNKPNLMMLNSLNVPNSLNNQLKGPINQSNIANNFQPVPNFSNPLNYSITNQPVLRNPAYQINPTTRIPSKQI